MKNVLFISGDGAYNTNGDWKVYSKYFNKYECINKNYFFTQALKTFVPYCEILNFSTIVLAHPRFNFLLESYKIPGSTHFRILTVSIINFLITKLILIRLKINRHDLILFSDNLFFQSRTLMSSMKKLTSSEIVLLSNVSPNYLLGKAERECIPLYDSIYISDPGHLKEWKDLGAKNVVILPISAGHPNSFQRKIINYESSKIYDVTFIGRLDGHLHYHRLEILNYLVTKGVPLSIWTWSKSDDSLKDFPLLETVRRGNAYGEKMVRILSQSKISLNIHILSQPQGGNLRLFEIPSAKSMQIADKCHKDWFVDGDEIVIYNHRKDLLKKINYYLNNHYERNRIINKAYNRLINEHTYEHRVKSLLKDF